MPDNNHMRMQVAGKLLESLLLRPPYRARWQRFDRRGPAGGILNQSAVAQVIADYLWDSGERPETDISLPRGLKDRVHRALRGEVLTLETLEWFIAAFQMGDEDAGQLRGSLFDVHRERGVPVTDTLRTPQRLPIPQRHRTVAVFERHIVGAVGRIAAHRTTRAIVACEDGVVSYPYRMVRGATGVKVLRGGRVTARHQPVGSSPILEITLSTPLRLGQIASLEYEVEFAPDSAIVYEYRRVAHARADNVDIVVEFHPQRLPEQVWWAVWDDYRDGNILEREEASLDSDGCVHQFVPYLRDAAVGFFWKWLP